MKHILILLIATVVLAQPLPPEELTITPTDSGMLLQWAPDEYTGLCGYRVYHSITRLYWSLAAPTTVDTFAVVDSVLMSYYPVMFYYVTTVIG